MHQKSKLHFIECLHHRHLAYVRAKTHTATITSRRIYKKNKAISSLIFLGHIEDQTTQEGCPTNHNAASSKIRRISSTVESNIKSRPIKIIATFNNLKSDSLSTNHEPSFKSYGENFRI